MCRSRNGLIFIWLSLALLWFPAGAKDLAKDPARGECRKKPADDNFADLISSVEAGDVEAAACLAIKLPTLDGGDLEDAIVALGVFSGKDMKALVEMYSRGQLSSNDFRDALTMLPGSFADRPDAQLAEVMRRKQMLRGIADRRLFNAKNFGLIELEKFEAEIKCVQK